jgi:hypothetical protein
MIYENSEGRSLYNPWNTNRNSDDSVTVPELLGIVTWIRRYPGSSVGRPEGLSY